MMDERIQLLRELTRLFNEGDIDGIANLVAEDAVGLAPEGWPEPGPFIGRDALRRQYARLREEWEQLSLSHRREEIRGDWILLELHWKAEGAASGVPLEMAVFGAYRVERNQLVEVRYYWSWQDALVDVGLADEPVTPR